MGAYEAEYDLGAEYMSTLPLIGDVYTQNWKATTLRANKSYCAPLSAAVDRHGFWFHKQQQAERDFVDDIPEYLCGDKKQTDSKYRLRLNNMLTTMRDAINTHVHSAFFVKAACKAVAKECLASIDGGIGAPAANVTLSSPAQQEGPAAIYKPGGAYCINTVMEHERYNLVEGYFIQNMTMRMIEAGAAFCRDPHLVQTVATLANDLETVLDYHASNIAFDSMRDSFADMICVLPDADGHEDDRYDALYKEVADNIDRLVTMASTDKLCAFDEEHSTPIINNPPNVADMISVLAQNLEVHVQGAATAIDQYASKCIVNAKQQSIADKNSTKGEQLRQKLLGRLHAVGVEPWRGTAQEIIEDMDFQAFGLPTVYHKLTLTCSPNDVDVFASTGKMCYSKDENGTTIFDKAGGSDGDSSPIFDLTTNLNCTGSRCSDAARVVLSYQTLLGKVTKMRWDMIQVYQGKAPTEPYMEQDVWIVQRNCDAFTNMAKHAISIKEAIPELISALKSSSEMLEVSCVAPPRVITQEGGFPLWEGQHPNGHEPHSLDVCVP